MSSNLNPNAKNFIPKMSSKLNPRAKNYIPNLPGFNEFIDYNTSYNSNVRELVKNTKKQYSNIVERYMNIFEYVCNTRSIEEQYVEQAIKNKKNKKNSGINNKKANYEAFLNLRTFKNNEANDKVEKYNELIELENELMSIFKTKKLVYKFINALNKSEIFKKFQNDYPQCDIAIHPSDNYSGLKKYLKHSLKRENIKSKRKNNNFPQL
jgi:hypothetical protein